jgi:hypothetical protein
MMGVGPAGRWFIRPKVSGRRTNVRTSGGMKVVYGSVAMRKDLRMTLV